MWDGTRVIWKVGGRILAEDPAEVEFIRSRTGPWRTVLTALGVWDNSIQLFGGSPVEWAKEIGLLDVPCLLAHVNYVDDSDIDLLAGGKAPDGKARTLKITLLREDGLWKVRPGLDSLPR